ncbi:hypothetical protein [Paenibacillus larvae]|nr:hypothetical protein [Paenibacillus larvae]MCY7520886.1 hypothetical protein [Paenibacillus larvae]MCY9500211.1 hypothetical protein [Paenibacillus larvae]MCY9679276.1 hypothetical protein [Paenibacillus larvae]MCY9747248.1 hypothetical protein [Paenibacillus larvae]MCY9751286.1 hypothetical protein [Paenibacillus larvae]
MTVVRYICMIFFGLSSAYHSGVSYNKYQANDVFRAIYHILLALFWIAMFFTQIVVSK